MMAGFLICSSARLAAMRLPQTKRVTLKDIDQRRIGMLSRFRIVRSEDFSSEHRRKLALIHEEGPAPQQALRSGYITKRRRMYAGNVSVATDPR